MTDQELLGRLNGLSFIAEMALVTAHSHQKVPIGMPVEKRDIRSAILHDLSLLTAMTENITTMDVDFQRGMLDSIDGAAQRIDTIMSSSTRSPG